MKLNEIKSRILAGLRTSTGIGMRICNILNGVKIISDEEYLKIILAHGGDVREIIIQNLYEG